MLDALHPPCVSQLAQQGSTFTLTCSFLAICLRNASAQRAPSSQTQGKTEQVARSWLATPTDESSSQHSRLTETPRCVTIVVPRQRLGNVDTNA